jgi:hypothetical protein
MTPDATKRFFDPVFESMTLKFIVCLAAAVFVSGCGKFSLIPVTLDELKDLTFGRQKSFSYALTKVLPATAYHLEKADFRLRRIEYFSQAGLVEARWEDTAVVIEFESITPKATNAVSRISRNLVDRYYSLEDTIFENVETSLENNDDIDMNALTGDMFRIHLAPDPASPVIGYLGVGADVSVRGETGDWAEIALEKGPGGYIRASNVR